MHVTLITHNSAAYEAMIQLRLTVLLNPIGVPENFINKEKEAADLLIAAYENDTLIGCCVLTKLNESTIQLRQMAVQTDLQKKGTGAAILQFAEKTAREKSYQTLVLHARDAVIPFYEKCGYVIAGEGFTEVGIPHHKMTKEL